jgi:hypothetical protein
MEALIETIRAAVVPEATAEARATGANACRTILSALEATAGQPLAAQVASPPNASQIASAVSALRGVPAEQLLDMAIARLRAALPAGVEVAPAMPLKFHMISPPKFGGRP